MTARLWLALLIALLVSVASLDARAGMTWLDDAAETSGDSGGSVVPVMLPTAARSADATSGPIATGGGMNGFIRVRTTSFIGSPVFTIVIEVPDGSGTWANYCTTAAIPGTGTYNLLISTGAATTSGAIDLVCSRPLPPVFRVFFDWTSGTSASVRVDGWAW